MAPSQNSPVVVTFGPVVDPVLIIFHEQLGARNTGDIPTVAAVGGVNEANTTALLGIDVLVPLLAVLLLAGLLEG